MRTKTFCMPSLEYSKETFPCQASESDISVTLVLSSEDQALETAIFQTRFHFWFMTYVLFDLSEGTGWVKLWFNIDQTKVYNIWFVINTIKYKRFLEDICSFLYEHIKCFLERYVKAFFAQCVTWDVISAQSNQINVSQILTMMPNICFRLHPALFVGLLRGLPKRNATECVRHLSSILLIGQSRFVILLSWFRPSWWFLNYHHEFNHHEIYH